MRSEISFVRQQREAAESGLVFEVEIGDHNDSSFAWFDDLLEAKTYLTETEQEARLAADECGYEITVACIRKLAVDEDGDFNESLTEEL